MTSVGEKPRLTWLPIVTAGAVWAGFLAITFNAAAWEGFHALWPWTLRPIYHDWHVLRAGWLTAMRGGDPLADAANPFNYPRFVLGAAHLGAVELPAEWAGLLLAACLLAAIVLTLGQDRRVPPWLVAVALVAPPVLLLIDRGNLDAVAFIATALALASLHRVSAGNLRVGLAACAFFFAALLKLYPVVSLVVAGVFWPDRRRSWFLVLLAAWLLWAALAASEIALVMQKTTRGLEPAYGYALPASRWYFDTLARHGSIAQAHASMIVGLRVSATAFGIGLLIAIAAGWLRAPRIAAPVGSNNSVIAFACGVAIYVGTFMLGTNWSYRLVFLVVCWPLLWQYARGPRRAPWAIAGLVGTAVVMFAPFHLPTGLFALVQAVNWITAWILVFGLAVLVRHRFALRIDDAAPADGTR